MIITCPNCQTKYQVAYEAIGSAGRKVQCASCNQSWQQVSAPAAQPDLRLVPEGGPEVDQLYETPEELTNGPEAFRPLDPVELRPRKAENPAELRARQKAFSRRQTAMVSSLPLARMRRTARVVASVLLVGIVAVGYLGRVQIVERSPDMAGIYEAIGGLDLSSLQSMRSLSDGKEVLVVSAQIVGLQPHPVSVPPVLVSLLDDTGASIYEWSVAPRIRDLMAGERATFDTRLPLPPAEAVTVRLSFARGSAAASGENVATERGQAHAVPR
jgi:predicted Zn finger-like uncharacterized protein